MYNYIWCLKVGFQANFANLKDEKLPTTTLYARWLEFCISMRWEIFLQAESCPLTYWIVFIVKCSVV